jgi:hypothetical protein
MQFKHSRLVSDRLFVNACLGGGVLFLAACGGGSGDSADGTPDPARGSEAGISLPAVWSTRALDRSVADIALAGGAASAIAVAYEGSGIQLFNLEGDRTTQIAELETVDLSQGAFMEFGETGLTVFPGIDADGRLVGYAHSEGLPEPAQLDLPIETGGPVTLLCSRALGFDDEGDLEIAFRSEGNRTGTIGTLGTQGDEFVFEAIRELDFPDTADGCALGSTGVEFSVGSLGMATLDRGDSMHTVLLETNGDINLARQGERADPISIRRGISVAVPEPITALDALGQPLGGGYPGGVIVVGGPTGSGDQLVFIDASPMTTPER